MSIYHQEYPQQEDKGVGVYLEDGLFKKTKTKTRPFTDYHRTRGIYSYYLLLKNSNNQMYHKFKHLNVQLVMQMNYEIIEYI